MQKSIQEIVEETVAYYSEDINRRAVFESQCVYLAPNGNMCAVGRCMLPELLGQSPQCAAEHLPQYMHTETLDELLQPEYRGHPENFWQALQILHDRGSYWIGADGVAARKAEVEAILKRFAPQN